MNVEFSSKTTKMVFFFKKGMRVIFFLSRLNFNKKKPSFP